MKNKINFTIIAVIFILPLFLYYGFKVPKEGINPKAVAEVANKPNLIHFSQNMCLECRKLQEIMPSVEAEYRSKVVFVHVDIAKRTPENQKLIEKYNVKVVPTMVFVKKNGEIYKMVEGAISKTEFTGYLSDILK